MKQPKSLAEFWEKAENDSIDRAIATLERIRMKKDENPIKDDEAEESIPKE